jgi:DNA-binding MarR family transcriptional regulator
MNVSHLQHEVKKKDPFQSLEQEVCLNLMRTNDQMHIRFTRLFREHGLTPSQYNVLRILRGEGKPLECMEIASRTVTVVPGITGLIDRLEVARLVQCERSEDDRRKVYVAITEKALGLLAELDAPVMNLHLQMVRNLSRAELKQLNSLLEKARAG